MEDILSDILRLIRLKGCVYFVRDFWSPWAMQMEGGAVAQFHVVLRGQCVVESKGRKWAAVLSARMTLSSFTWSEVLP